MPLFFLLFACGLKHLRDAWQNHRAYLCSETSVGAAQKRIAWTMAGIVVLSVLNVNALKGPSSLKEWLLLSPPLHSDGNYLGVSQLVAVQSVIGEKARVAVVGAGAGPYYLDWQMIDVLGKCDWVIAHEPMHLPPPDASLLDKLTFFHPGHLKYDYEYSFGQLRPDVILHRWRDFESARPVLDQYYVRAVVQGFVIYLRQGSPNVVWDKVPGGMQPAG